MSREKITSDMIMSALGGVDEKWYALADPDSAAADVKKARAKKHFVLYEIKKLLGIRYLWAFLAIFLVLNSVIAFYSAGKTYAAYEPSQLISSFFEKYFDDPEELDAHYAEIQAFNKEQEELFMKAMQSGNYDFETESMPSIYSTDEDFPDSMLFHTLYSAVNAAADYPNVMQKVIERAVANLAEFKMMGIDEDSFTYRYQIRVIRLYEEVRDNVSIRVEYTHGWEEYFSYEIVNIFIFVFIIMLGSLIFAEEKQTGFLPIIRTSRYGRARTAAAKLITMLLLSSVTVLLFTATTWAVYGLRLGYSSPSNVLQSLSAYTLSPYRITIGQYFAISVGVKLLSFALFSSVVLLLSTVFYNYILIYLSGLAFYGLNFLLYTLKYIDSSSAFKNLNLVAVTAVDPLFVRYRAVNLFSEVCGYVPFMLVSFGIATVLCCSATVILFSRGINDIRLPALDTVTSSVMTAAAGLKNRFIKAGVAKTGKTCAARRYSMSLFGAEAYKTLISSRFILILLVLLALKTAYSVNVFTPLRSYSDTVYKEYMTRLEGEVTDEKLEYIAEERRMINDTLSKQTKMQQDYVNNVITFEEYREYLSDYNYAYSRSELLELVEDQADYLIAEKEKTGIDGWFVYDTGWKKLYGGDADLFLYTSILLLLAGSFASEYLTKSSSGSFAQILRATKNGRNATFRAKLFSSGVIAVLLALVFNAIDIAIVFNSFEMPAASAPLLSTQMFSSVSGSITFAGYLAVFILIRVAASLAMALLVCALSELLCRYLSVLCSAVVITLLPALFAYFGLSAADKVSYMNFFAGTPLYIASQRASLFGSGWAMLAIWLSAVAVAVAAVLVPARKMFTK